jgi:hypothetical protein
MHGRVASLVSTRSGHFKRVDQTTGAMRTRAPPERGEKRGGSREPI